MTLTRIDLHPLGGMAGDMFLAAVIDMRPDLEPVVERAIRAVGLPADWQFQVSQHNDGRLTGRQVAITPPPAPASLKPEITGRFSDIRARIDAAPLTKQIVEWAIHIFTLLAEAEGKVHGVPLEDVHFHEIADWDSVADIVGAAAAIAELNVPDWRVHPLPLGHGRVNTRHGPLSVPAPATALLLEGLQVMDDGIAGERVTPTGAAIARALALKTGKVREQSLPLIAGTTGIGFGHRQLPGISNCLRALSYSATPQETGHASDIVARIGFEVDDQSPEDLALALESIRAHPGVRDVSQWNGIGKKGRVTAGIRILAEPAATDAVIDLCFAETTTLGLRLEQVQRQILPRKTETRNKDNRSYRIKVTSLPGGGERRKIEADDLAGLPRHTRRELRRLWEQETDDERDK